MSSKLVHHKQGEDMASKDKIIDKIEKKIDSIEKLHDKESMLCEEVKDLLADLRDQEEDERYHTRRTRWRKACISEIRRRGDRDRVRINSNPHPITPQPSLTCSQHT